MRRAEAQRDEDDDHEGKHSFGQSAGSSVFGQGVRAGLARQNAVGGISMRDSCGQHFKDDTGKLFKNDGGKDIATSSGENSDDGEGKCTSKSGGENFHSGKGFGNAGVVFVLGFGGLINQDAGDGHTEVNIVSRALKARVEGFASKHGSDQAASAKLRGTTDSVAWDVVEHRHQRQGAPPKRIHVQDGHGAGARGKVLLGQRGAVGGRRLDRGQGRWAVH